MRSSEAINYVKELLEMARIGAKAQAVQARGVEMVKEITSSEASYFHTFDQFENAIDLCVWSESVRGLCNMEPVRHYPLEEAGIWADSVRQKKAVIHNDFENLTAEGRGGLPEAHFPVHRHLSVPVISQSRIVSIVGVGNKSQPYDEEDAENVRILAELIWSITEQLKAQAILENYAFEDGLTAVSNRRRFDNLLLEEWNRHRRQQDELSLIMFDIDHFKEYNDALGHDQGDLCLQQVAAILKRSFRRSGETVCRYGGEEFIVLLPSTSLVEARGRAEFGRQQILAEHISHPDSKVSDSVTVSVGVATTIPMDDNPEALVKAVDMKLYDAKLNGRNQVA